MRHLTIRTEAAEEVVDITAKLQELVSQVGLTEGMCTAFARHTTCALSTADLDPGTDRDMLDAFRAMIPELSYRHPHDPSHVGDHIMATLIGPSVSVPVSEGELVLGRWQRVVLFELDGPRERDLVLEMVAMSPARGEE